VVRAAGPKTLNRIHGQSSHTLKVRAPQANKKKTSANKSITEQAQAKDKCRRRQIQAPQAAGRETKHKALRSTKIPLANETRKFSRASPAKLVKQMASCNLCLLDRF
jgi:hypothetical protein